MQMQKLASLCLLPHVLENSYTEVAVDSGQKTSHIAD